jgi:hypothetical protein
MRKTILFFVILALLSTGCGKDDQPDTVSATLDGAAIALRLDARLKSGQDFQFDISHVDDAGGKRFSTVIFQIPRAQSHYTINRENIPGVPYVESMTTESGGAPLDHYGLLSAENNTISITELDVNKRLVRGTFQLSFLRDAAQKLDVFPDTLRLREGRFEVIYEEN